MPFLIEISLFFCQEGSRDFDWIVRPHGQPKLATFMPQFLYIFLYEHSRCNFMFSSLINHFNVHVSSFLLTYALSREHVSVVVILHNSSEYFLMQ